MRTWMRSRDGRYIVNQHQWRPTTVTGPRWCNVCESVVYGLRSQVVTCDICGMFAHSQCAFHSVTNKACPCRTAAVSSDTKPTQPQHHWVKGNIDPTDTCEVCGLFCGSLLALSGMHCSWCHRRVHETCFQEHQRSPILERCDLGPYRRLVLPSTSIVISANNPLLSPTPSTPRRALRKVKSAVSRFRSFQSKEVESRNEFTITAPKDTTPLLVFVNSRSGGQMGVTILRKFRKWLNPLQVYDLSNTNPDVVLNQFRHIGRLKILVCGGDGTIGWILSAMDDLALERPPAIAILPLGTGNDLARVLGWGGGYTAQDISQLLYHLEQAHVGVLDRWLVDLNGKKRAVMNNYMGVGVDAQVALEFHNKRERAPTLFSSQFVNKLWYARYGSKNYFFKKCVDLPKKIEIICDGEVIELPQTAEGVILLNINSFGGGSKLWHEHDSDSDSDAESVSSDTHHSIGPSSFQDGLIDVVAVYGSLHLGKLQVGLSKAIRLCQCKTVEIVLKEELPMQIDGEPWKQSPCTINVKFLKQSFVLCKTIAERDFVTTKVNEVLDWAESTDVITATQRDILLKEISWRIKEKRSLTTSNSRRSLPSLETSTLQ